MANGSIQVGPQGVRRIDPRLLEEQAAGMGAQGQLQDMQNSPAMANALRMSQAQMPGVRGQGYAAEGPSGWNALATALERRKGQSQIDSMSEQSKALRGDVTAGQKAGLQRQADLGERDFDYKRELGEQRTAREEDARKERFAHEIELEKLRQQGRLTKATNQAKKNPFGKMSDKKQLQVENAGDRMRTANRVLGAFKDEYGAETIKGANVPGLTKAMNWAAGSMPMLTNERQEDRAQWWRDYKKFFELPEVKEGFGSQFTKSEMGRWDAANIHENMEAKTIQSNIRTRMDVLKEANDRLNKSMKIRYPDASEFIDYETGDTPSEREKPKTTESAEDVIVDEVESQIEKQMSERMDVSKLSEGQQTQYKANAARIEAIRQRKAELQKKFMNRESSSASTGYSSGGGF